MKKVLIAILVVMVVGLGGCALLIGGAAKSVNDAQKSDTASSAAFAKRWNHVKVGDALTGKGGQTMAQVKAILGRGPGAGNTMTSKSSGYTLVTWSYDFALADGSVIFTVDFTNGHTSGKARL